MKERQATGTELGSRLRQLREGLGLIQQDVANLFQTNRNVPSQWESGLREPSYEHLLKLADFYGVTVDWLLGREGADKDSPGVKLAKNRLHDYLREHEAQLPGTTPGQRLCLAVQFLTAQDPVMFSLDRIACQLLVTPETFERMLFGQAIVTGPVLQRFGNFANLPELFFYQPAPQLEDPLVKYRTLVERFQAEGLTPADVEQQLWGVRRGARRPRKGVEV